MRLGRFTRLILPILFVIFFSLPAAITLFKTGFFYSHDGILHTARLAAFYQGFLDGQIPPRWAENLVSGLGSPVVMFYGILPNAVGSLMVSLGASFTEASELVLAQSIIFSAVTFFFFARELTSNRGGIVGAILYTWAPYRFVDIYVRGAIPEAVAFVFPPLLFLGMVRAKSNRKWGTTLGIAGLAGTILSHNVLAIMFLAIFMGFCAVTKNWRGFLRITIPGVLLTTFFWAPAVFLSSAASISKLTPSEFYQVNFVSLKSILYSPWGWGGLHSSTPLSTQLGLAQISALVIGTITVFWKRNTLGIYFLIVTLVAAILMMPVSAVLWEKITPIQIVLYPWRFLAVGIFGSAILGAYGAANLPGKYLKNIAAVFLVTLAIFANRNHLLVSQTVTLNDEFFLREKGTTDTVGEFLPTSANYQVIKACESSPCPWSKVEATGGTRAVIKTKRSNYLLVETNTKQETKLVVNTLYFPGWEVRVRGSRVPVKLTPLGTMEVKIPEGAARVEARFERTNLVKIADTISLVTALVLGGLVLKRLQKIARGKAKNPRE